MKYQKPIELWGREVDLRSGALRLQRGQHVLCGGGAGRFVGVTPGGSIWVMYSGRGTDDFMTLVGRMKKFGSDEFRQR